MKKLFTLAVLVLAMSSARADVCVPSDPDFDPADCAAAGGTVGTPVGTGGGPGSPGGPGPAGVPIDGGLSLLLAAGGAMGARRVWQKRKMVNA